MKMKMKKFSFFIIFSIYLFGLLIQIKSLSTNNTFDNSDLNSTDFNEDNHIYTNKNFSKNYKEIPNDNNNFLSLDPTFSREQFSRICAIPLKNNDHFINHYINIEKRKFFYKIFSQYNYNENFFEDELEFYKFPNLFFIIIILLIIFFWITSFFCITYEYCFSAFFGSDKKKYKTLRWKWIPLIILVFFCIEVLIIIDIAKNQNLY
jgi:hypothetical protein